MARHIGFVAFCGGSYTDLTPGPHARGATDQFFDEHAVTSHAEQGGVCEDGGVRAGCFVRVRDRHGCQLPGGAVLHQA